MTRARVLLAAPASGSGKTMITCGILKAFINRGLKISSFKCGPDYIDPLFHQQVLGIRSSNLDLFFAGEQLPALLERGAAGTELSIIEGVMGYYDGLGAASEEASTYEVAKALKAPVVLIINARGQSLSALATLKGFLDFRADSGIGGVIFNQMSKPIFEALKPEVEKLGLAALGYVPKAPQLMVESRHLGLVAPHEVADLNRRLEELAQLLEESLDLDRLLALAKAAPPLPSCPQEKLPRLPQPVKVAVARDEAFSFLYRDNLELLEELGAELLYFSPLRDKALPQGTQGLLLPGGYPELYAQQLSENLPLRQQIASAIEGGLPCLAECGGFLYLHRELEDMEGRSWPMVGLIPGRAWHSQRLGRFGYINLSTREDQGLLRAGERLRGHEFHYYESDSCGEAMTATKPSGKRSWRCIHSQGALLAGFPHLYYRSSPMLLWRFLSRCGEEPMIQY